LAHINTAFACPLERHAWRNAPIQSSTHKAITYNAPSELGRVDRVDGLVDEFLAADLHEPTDHVPHQPLPPPCVWGGLNGSQRRMNTWMDGAEAAGGNAAIPVRRPIK
jgi:hypothetical protein